MIFIILFALSSSAVIFGMQPLVKEKVAVLDQRNKCYDFLLSDEFFLESKKASLAHERIAFCSRKLIKQANDEFITQKVQGMTVNERVFFHRRLALGISLAIGFYQNKINTQRAKIGFNIRLSKRLDETLKLLSHDEALLLFNEIKISQKNLLLKSTQEKSKMLNDLGEKCLLFLRSSAMGQEYKKNIVLELINSQLFKYIKSLAPQKGNLNIAQMLMAVYEMNEQFPESLSLRLQIKDYQGMAQLCSNLQFKNSYEELLDILHNSKEQRGLSTVLVNYEPFMTMLKKDKARNSDKTLITAHIYAHILESVNLEKYAQEIWEICDDKRIWSCESILLPICLIDVRKQALWFMAKNPATAMQALQTLGEYNSLTKLGDKVLKDLRKEALSYDLLPYVLVKRLERLVASVSESEPSEKDLKQTETQEISQILEQQAKEILSKKPINEIDSSFLASYCLYKFALNLGNEDKRIANILKKYRPIMVELKTSEENRQKLELVSVGIDFILDKTAIISRTLEERLNIINLLKKIYSEEFGLASKMAEILLTKMAMSEDMLATAMLTVLNYKASDASIPDTWYYSSISKPDTAIDDAVKILKDAGLYKILKKQSFPEGPVCPSKMLLILYHRIFAEFGRNNWEKAKTLIDQAIVKGKNVMNTTRQYGQTKMHNEVKSRIQELWQMRENIEGQLAPK